MKAARLRAEAACSGRRGRAPARLPEVDFVDAGDVRDEIEPLIIRDTDIEFHLHPARIGRLYYHSYSFKATMPSPIRLYMPKSQIMIRFYREMGNCQ